MKNEDIERLRRLTHFEDLVAYLRDELDWPIEVEDADEITFDYDPAELGIAPQHAVKIETIKQIRPLVETQPWGVFYVQFESKRLPVVVLRRILRSLVPKSRQSDPDRPVWRMSDLLFISAQGEPGYRSISFAHFRRRENGDPELRTFSWDARETHLFYIKNLNLEALRWPDDEANVDAWRRQWRDAFTVEHRYTVRTSQNLAREMARHAATVRAMVGEVYAVESDEGPLHALYASFKEALLHDLTPETFADMVAQTVAYGLFSAATQTQDLSFDRVVDLIPNTNPFLRDLLAELTSEGAVDLEELGVGQLVELLRQTDVEAILRDFGRQTGGGREDPVVHFYELFLNEYDKEQRVQRGVFYTPDPVVSYIVRSVDYLLREEFGLADGLADTSVDPETGEPLVQLLDIATGTGTFLAHVIDQIEETVKTKPGADWNGYVAEHLLPRLNGFELMMAPYAVAHMKLGLKLRQTGYDFASDERLRVFLTNTLEEPVQAHETLALAGFLSKESNAAARVKRQVPITVVVGNPPYAGHSANESAWIAGLLRGSDDQGRDVENYFAVDGHGLNERNPKWLNDDYVKFIRFGQWRVNQTGAGILAFITNHGYLDNPTFRGMRQSLMADFDVIYVLDLHGSLIKKETSPDGTLDENVFDIQPGVAILLAIKLATKDSSEIYHADLWGLRGQKYADLLETSVNDTVWTHLHPIAPFYLFVPRDVTARAEYLKGQKTSDILPVNSMGITTGRDAFATDFSEEELYERIKILSSELDDSVIREMFSLKDSSSFSLAQARTWARSSKTSDCVIPISYRPFDDRWVIYSSDILARNREEVCQHQISKSNFTLVTFRAIRESPWIHVFIARYPIAKEYVSSLDNCFAFPLYLYPDTKNATLFDTQEPTDAPGGRSPNLAPEFITDLSDRLGLRFIPDGRGDLSQTFGPEDVLHYTYAVFHSPTYRERYAEFLKIDFPRLPLTSDVGLFRDLTGLGADLVALHLLEDDYPAASWNQHSRG
ncbi:MAG TPA: DNA methyltransferase, partial [Chloroflexi bacterium]|nr:DNA methyltransferase [Chloroflexota bacterium]